MKLFETQEQKKAITLASVIMAILLLLTLFLGLSYLDPPPENGIAINFGNTDMGMGNDNSEELTKTSPQATSASSAAEAKEEVLTQEVEEAIVIKENPKKKPTPTPTDNPEPKDNPTPKPSQSTTDALNSLLNAQKQEGTTSKSDGTGNQPGNQGDLDGSKYSTAYFGSGGGTGSGSGRWGLNGRSLASSGIVQPNCNDEGTVVVQITVNKNGVVISTQFSARGSNTTSKCLIDAARETAKKYRWNPDSNAPDNQIGFIVVNFKNRE